MMRMVTATEARIHLGELMRQVVANQEPVIVERRGRPHVVLLSMDEYERLKAAQARGTWRQDLERAIQAGARIATRRGARPLPLPEKAVDQTGEG